MAAEPKRDLVVACGPGVGDPSYRPFCYRHPLKIKQVLRNSEESSFRKMCWETWKTQAGAFVICLVGCVFVELSVCVCKHAAWFTAEAGFVHSLCFLSCEKLLLCALPWLRVCRVQPGQEVAGAACPTSACDHAARYPQTSPSRFLSSALAVNISARSSELTFTCP